MNELCTLTLDLKKGRIRVYKAALHKIGTPKYIQILVNTEKKCIAVRAAHVRKSKACVEETHITVGGDSCDFYSVELLDRLRQLRQDLLQTGESYRLTGTQVKKDIILFPLETAERIEEREEA